MNIAAMSTGLSQASLQTQVGLSVEKLAINTAEDQGSQFVNALNSSTPHPTLGTIIDVKG